VTILKPQRGTSKMKKISFMAAIPLLLPVCAFGQLKAVRTELTPARVSQVSRLVVETCGRKFEPITARKIGFVTMYSSRFDLITFVPDDSLPFMGTFGKRLQTAKSARALSTAQQQVVINKLASQLKFDRTGTKLRISESRGESRPSSNSNSLFVYFEEARWGLGSRGDGKRLEIQLDSRTGELISFTCRRRADIVGGKPLELKQLTKIASEKYRSLDIGRAKIEWISPKRFKLTEALDVYNSKIMAVFSVADTKSEVTRFFRADSGTYLGAESQISGERIPVTKSWTAPRARN
jgi:hypothetical protein